MCIVYEQVRDYFPSVQCWNNADQLFSSKIFSIFPIHGLFYLLCFPSWILIQLHTIHTRHLHKRISIFRFRFPFHPFVFQTKKYIFFHLLPSNFLFISPDTFFITKQSAIPTDEHQKIQEKNAHKNSSWIMVLHHFANGFKDKSEAN